MRFCLLWVCVGSTIQTPTPKSQTTAIAANDISVASQQQLDAAVVVVVQRRIAQIVVRQRWPGFVAVHC
jgi:hypothetical protein